jgi:nucleotide-binding universal stress UspA family protein
MMCVANGQSGVGLVKLGRALTSGQATPSRLYALHLIRPTERASFQLRRAPESTVHPEPGDTEGALAPLLQRAQRMSLEVRPLSFVSAEPGLDICRTAEAKQADLILLGWHRPLLPASSMMGGTVHTVMQEAGTHVAVLVDRGLEDIRRVLVPFIGSRHDRAALGMARRLLRGAGAEVTVLHVTVPEARPGRPAPRLLDEELRAEASGPVRFKAVAHASPEEAVLAEVQAGGYDLVVVGVGAEWGLEGRLFVASRERLLRDSHTSLLIIRQPEPVAESAAASAPSGSSERESGSEPGAPLPAGGGAS